jgi:nucleotide-binding universal stress UspA family protein
MRVLAALDSSAGATPVIEFAAALARVLAADLDAIHVRANGVDAARSAAVHAGVRLRIEENDPRSSLLHEAHADDVVAIVLGRSGRPAAGPVGAVALELLTTLPKPVAVVPHQAAHPARLSRVLVPLEGTPATSVAPRRTIELARDAGLEIILLHVFDLASLPSFTDQPQHETATWTAEFLARYCPCPPEDVRLETRVGDLQKQVLGVAREVDADVIALGWAQELAAGRAPVVNAALEEANVPIFLIPVTVEPAAVASAPASLS